MGLFSNMIMGKGNRPDYTPDMMPKNRWELFFEMLRLNFLNLLKLNMMYFVFWIPFWIWTWLNLEMLMQYDSMEAFVQSGYFSVYLIGIQDQLEAGPGHERPHRGVYVPVLLRPDLL